MDKEKTIEINRVLATMVKNATIKDCSHPNKAECRLPIVSAHSLQRQGALKYLEKMIKGNANLYCHTERKMNDKLHFLDLKPIGRKIASTFFGFCTFHDTNLFSEIENDPNITDINSDEHCFLHSYRSFSHSYHHKYEENKLFSSTDPSVVELLERLYGKKHMEYRKQGIDLAIKDLKKIKQKLDELLLKKEYDGLTYLCFEYNYRIPVACAGVSSPSSYFSKEVFNYGISESDEYSDIITTVLPLEDRSVVILAVLTDDLKSIKYLDEIDNIKYEFLQQKFLSFHIMNNHENVFLSPYYYDKRGVQWKQGYCNLLNEIINNETKYFVFNKTFPINYFCVTESIKK